MKNKQLDKPLRIKPDNVKYVVQPGDSLWRIAIEYGITLEELMRINQLKTDV